ncbi:ORF203 [Staphylococcus phage Twort]|uniref:ORF203 n=1 Tax=Staphylococcus phage Twort (strain DSM 17442 / HER 48) TaxID=2908167 RepID=Q4Z9F1_BPTWO|nr:ORF203 [Staphylococcus phage Twort]AAX92460.1 ORF203 [Staphylococcus phage Twort]
MRPLPITNLPELATKATRGLFKIACRPNNFSLVSEVPPPTIARIGSPASERFLTNVATSECTD